MIKQLIRDFFAPLRRPKLMAIVLLVSIIVAALLTYLDYKCGHIK